MDKVLITGADGQLGNELNVLSAQFPDNIFCFTNRNALDITDKHAVETYVLKNNITAIVSAGAYTAVDQAETETEQAFLVNETGVKNLALTAKKNDCKLIHISTDYVFDGNATQPYKPTDKTNPINAYGKSKLAGETVLNDINPENAVIIRTAWLYSSFGSNFVKTMLRLGIEKPEINVVNDQVGSPTYARDLAQAILTLLPKLQTNNVKTYHYTNQGVCSWFELAKAIMKTADLTCKVNPIPSEGFPTPAPRPKYSVLDTQDIARDFGLKIPTWEDGLQRCLDVLGNEK